MKTKLQLLILLISISTLSYGQFYTEYATTFNDASRGIRQISIVNDNVVWAIAYDGSGGGANVQELTLSVDGGLTWQSKAINLGGGTGGLGIAQISAIDANTAWIVAYPNSAFGRGGIWKTVDAGDSWTKQVSAVYNDASSFSNVVNFWDANNGFCQGDPIGGYYELYTTNDGGTNWTRVPSSGIPSPLSGEYGYVSQLEVVGNRMWWTTNKGRIFRSDDKGLTHQVFQSPISDFGSAAMSGNISFWDANNGLLLNSLGELWGTTDGGETWVSKGNVDNVGSDIECIVGTTKAVFTGSNGASPAVSNSSYSLDSGNTWTLIDNVQRLELEFSATTGFAGGFNTDNLTGGMFKYTGTELGLASVVDNEIASFNAYPNPINNNLTIEGVNIISNVSIYNMLGQKVLESNPNELVVLLDVSNFKAGSYFVKVTINNAIETMKIVK